MSETTGQKLTEQFEMFGKHKIEQADSNSKKCTHCGEVKKLGSFPFREASQKARRKECRKCANDSRILIRELAFQNPKSASPNYACPCCLKTEDQIRENGGYPDRTIWVLDHNHTTKEFRGWICNPCNVGIGRFEDKIENLIKAIDYLERDNE